MGNTCSCSSGVVEPELGTLDNESQYAVSDLSNEDGIRKSSNASQVTHWSDEMTRSPGNQKNRMEVKPPSDPFIVEDSDEEDEGFLDANFDPNAAEASVGPFPNDRRLSTSTQEAVYIYQASARAAGKIHDENIRNISHSEVPSAPTSRDHWKKNKKQTLLPPTPDDYSMPAIIIVEEDMRNRSRMGRQSLCIQPQPEPKFIQEYRKKKERMSVNGAASSWMLWEENEEKKSLASGRTSLEVLTIPERPESSSSKVSRQSANSTKSQDSSMRKKRNSL